MRRLQPDLLPLGVARERHAVAYLVFAGAVVFGFVAAAVLLAITLPYHQWDSFAFGDWSRAIAEHGQVDPLTSSISVARPVFYELQGFIWSVTGISFTAGRLLSLLFGVVLVVSVPFLQQALTASRLEIALAAAFIVAIPAFAQQTLSGQTDVPGAAMVALVAALVLRRPTTRLGNVALIVAAALAVMTKQTVLLALLPLAFALLVVPLRELPGRLRGPAGSLAAGLALGLTYDLVMAIRAHQDLPAFLKSGTGGIWAEFAARARAGVLERADVLGSGLRLPLTFALVYGIVRVLGLRHRYATPLALAAGVAWSIAGPLAAGVPNGAFARAEDGFTFVGFAVILTAAALLPEDDAPRRSTLAFGLALALPSLIGWVMYAAYADRLAATAWPGLTVLIACVVAAGIRGIGRAGTVAALAPLPIVAMAVWMGVSTLDGLDGSMWAQYRSLSLHELGDNQLTMNIVLPALQSALATAQPELGDGRLVTGDPTFSWFLEGRVDTTTPARCRDVSGDRVFVLLTGDESIQAAHEAGRLGTAEEWARCKAPKLRQLSDGNNGYAVFVVDRT